MMKLGVDTLAGARRQTIEELSGLLFVVQEMGGRLADETHGEAYGLIRDRTISASGTRCAHADQRSPVNFLPLKAPGISVGTALPWQFIENPAAHEMEEENAHSSNAV